MQSINKTLIKLSILFLLGSCGGPLEEEQKNSSETQNSKAEVLTKVNPNMMGHESGSDLEGIYSPRLAGDVNEDLLKSFLDEKQSHPGSSKKGRVFDEGPRQSATLLGAHLQSKFPLTLCSPSSEDYFQQGIAQLHAFQNYEAERSFRHSFSIDAQCVMALWGASMSQIVFGGGNVARGAKYIRLAKSLSTKIKLSDLERALIDSLDKYFDNNLATNKTLSAAYAKALYQLAEKTKEDEIKAFAVLFVWGENSKKLYSEIGSSVQELSDWIDDIHSRKPFHPSHHYKIHLWNDMLNEKKTLSNAQIIGESYPVAAHMWHMAAHTYMGLSDFPESDVQFEAAQKLDNKWAEQNLEFPYLLHNYAHNASYWIYSLVSQGQSAAAEKVALEMMALPFHPLYNDPTSFTRKYNSPYLNAFESFVGAHFATASFDRLFSWEKRGLVTQLLLIENPQLNSYKQYILYVYACLHLYRGDVDEFNKIIKNLENYSDENSKKLLSKIDVIKKWYNTQDIVSFEAALKVSDPFDMNFLCVLAIKAKLFAEAEEILSIKTYPWLNRSLTAQLLKTQIALRTGRPEFAKSEFEIAQKMAMKIERNSEKYQLGSLLAKDLKITGEWVRSADLDLKRKLPPQDLGTLDSPQLKVPDFDLPDQNNKRYGIDEVVDGYDQVIFSFILGGSCLSCNKQVMDFAAQRDVLPPKTRVVFVTTDSQKELSFFLDQNDLAKIDNFLFLSDDELNTFKSFKVFDDFEKVPFHGTFVISSKNKNFSWLDRGSSPFMDLSWITKEILREKKMKSFSNSAMPYSSFSKDPRY